tara:strand:- start:287 stop:553 length:267 start_codon:yes stop_codon:yes gene_type:complete
MKKYLNQTTVNVVAIATAVVAGFSFVDVGQGPDKAMKEQMLANRRLDYDIARLKNCGQLKMAGIQFDPRSPMSFLCADVIVDYPNGTE